MQSSPIQVAAPVHFDAFTMDDVPGFSSADTLPQVATSSPAPEAAPSATRTSPGTAVVSENTPQDALVLRALKHDLAALQAALSTLHQHLAPPLPSSSASTLLDSDEAATSALTAACNDDSADELGVVRGYFADILSDVERVSTKLHERYESYCRVLGFTGQHHTDLHITLVGGYFGSLPDEVFLHILRFFAAKDLVICASVSKRWRHLCDDPSLWRALYKGAWVPCCSSPRVGHKTHTRVAVPKKSRHAHHSHHGHHTHHSLHSPHAQHHAHHAQHAHPHQSIKPKKRREYARVEAYVQKHLLHNRPAGMGAVTGRTSPTIISTRLTSSSSSSSRNNHTHTDIDSNDVNSCRIAAIVASTRNNKQPIQVTAPPLAQQQEQQYASPQPQQPLTGCGNEQEGADWKGVYWQRVKVEQNWRKGNVKNVQTLTGHTAWISCLQFDDEHIVSGAGDKTIRVWNVDDGRLEQVLSAPRGALCLQFDKHKIVSGYMDNSILFWELRTGRKMHTLNGHRGRVWALQYDDQKMVSGGADRCLKWWDIGSLQNINTVSNAHTDGISCLKFHGSHIVTGSADNLVKVWDTKSSQCVTTLQGEHDKAVFCVDVEGHTVLSGSHDSTIKMWDLRMNRCLQTFVGHQSGVFGLQFDDSKLVSCAGDQTIKVWDIKTGACMMTLAQHKDAIRAIQYDDHKIVSCSSTQDKTLKIWRLG